MKTSTIILFLSLLATVGQSADTNTYSNPTLGVTISKPADWQFATIEQHAENLARAKFKDKQLQEWIVKHSTAPLVVMMKHPEPFDDLNPSFKMNVKPLGKLPGDNPKAMIEIIIPQFRKAFENFELVVPPKDTTVAGHKAAYTKIHYSMKISDGRSFPTFRTMGRASRRIFFPSRLWHATG
jgi:hypothetical protein